VTPTRYRLLETIRAYCQAIDPDPDDTREAHANWVRGLAARSASVLRGERGGQVTRLLGRELPNLRAGIAHDLAHQPEHAVRTVGLLDWFWLRGGHSAEGRRLIDVALRAAPHARHADRARAYLARVSNALFLLEGHELQQAIEQAGAAIGEPTDDEHRTLYGQLKYYCAFIWLSTGEFAAAHDAADKAVTIGTELNLDWVRIAGLMTRNAALIQLGQAAAGQAGLIETITLAERSGPPWSAGWIRFALAISYLSHPATDTDPAARGAEALDLLRRAVTRFRDEEDNVFALAALYTGAHALALIGRPHDAARLRAAVHHHATRLGLRPELVRRFATPNVDEVVDSALTPTERDTADSDGANLSRSQMASLLAPSG